MGGTTLGHVVLGCVRLREPSGVSQGAVFFYGLFVIFCLQVPAFLSLHGELRLEIAGQ